MSKSIKKVMDRIKWEIHEYQKKRKIQIWESQLRTRLKVSDFSILCSNCIGGVIYHRLGKEYKSPTINLWMSQCDFLKFVCNLKEYLHYNLVFIESEYTYPVALLGDVTIYFNHYKTEEDARKCWDKRKKRIDYEKLYIIMYDRDGISEEDIRQLESVTCKNKIVLSDDEHPNLEYVKKLVPSGKEDGCQCMDRDEWGFWTFEKQFDFVSWLNNE